MSVPADRSPQWEEGRTSTRIRSSSTPPNDTAVERLTDDLLVEILSRVPAKSICRFKCVSNHWLGLIDHPDHCKKLPQTPAGFFHSSTATFQWRLEAPILFTSFPGRRCPPIDTSCTFLPNHRRVDLLDCCNGLLLCGWYDIASQGDEFRYAVCNPATEKWVILPDSGNVTNEVGAVRLCFDPVLSSHFRVFELVMDQMLSWVPDLVGVSVYSSETGRWVYKKRRWNAHIRLIKHQLASVFLNGYLHFQAKSNELSPYLAMVDTEGETWMDLGVPDGGLIDGFIQQSQGRLHYANLESNEDGAVIRLTVYVLNNYESKEWILKHSIETSYLFGGIDYNVSKFGWIAIHPECNLIFFTIGHANKFMCYSMDCRQVKMISEHVDGKLPYLPYVPLYKELQALRN